MKRAVEQAANAYAERAEIVERFFKEEAPRLAQLCHALANRFVRGGRLLAFGVGPAATDAQHISVEFVHPVIVGKRALPALALVNDGPSTIGMALSDNRFFLARQLATLARPEDIAVGLIHGPDDSGADAVTAALEQAVALGLLSVELTGPGSGRVPGAASFGVASEDPFLVQEVHETLYHVLWELVHVFFDHKGLLEDRPATTRHDTGGSSFLYPFLAEAEQGLERVLREVEGSIVQKAGDVARMRSESGFPDELAATADLIAGRIANGGKILAFGNGGSATDAQDLVVDLMAPPPGLRAVPAISLTNDVAVVTAVGNDVGFDNVFARQVIAYGSPGDVAVAISTSGGSRNVLAAVEEARRRDLLTVGLSGYGGGRLAELCDRAHVINADYIPRIQEAQATQYHVLRRMLE
ncbi:MAG: D-sedoheptulose-7-phosphate isomerase [Actinomycetota bacterium]